MARYVSGRDNVQMRPTSPSSASTVPTAHPWEAPCTIRVRQTNSANDGDAAGCGDGWGARSLRVAVRAMEGSLTINS